MRQESRITNPLLSSTLLTESIYLFTKNVIAIPEMHTISCVVEAATHIFELKIYKYLCSCSTSIEVFYKFIARIHACSVSVHIVKDLFDFFHGKKCKLSYLQKMTTCLQ